MIDASRVFRYLLFNKSRLQQEYSLTKIGVMGSVAVGRQHGASDLDIIVEFKNNTQNLFELKEKLRREMMGEFHVHVDICREKYIKPAFKNQILAKVKYV
ncbi:nucleotidyltransferase domain-containing protein [Desulfobotulus sp. H1]|uniref:Nucleotidyltransferase domain-containing protein n=1 Tax=Desulfobotulus pelophilus TaxID=2823377 RepID=A0ABT3NCT0_9BACT|nr:nucleotidyltransferase domain-containing protein [Desulfobotulus pelophilus]MCW7755277.1 nucleotidyltransferase domain-containing protein [Desulfobotulus pelophilus]